MSSVRNGSVTVSVDLMRRTCAPFAERSRVTVTRRHERRPVEAIARKGFLRGELGVERGEIFGRRVDQLDFRIERCIERRVQTNVAEPQCMGDSGQQQ